MTDDTPEPHPSAPTKNLGELVRAHRSYCALSQRVFADMLGMKEDSLSDIEIGRRDCPRGFLDSVHAVVAKFDREVEEAIAQAEDILGGIDEDNAAAHFRVTDRYGDEWQRQVIGRAAVESGLIMPILEGEYHRRNG